MGPPSLNGGNDQEGFVVRPGFTRLQWGRRLSTAEMSFFMPWQAEDYELQWGRRLSTAEIVKRSENPIPSSELQWGRRLSTAEISVCSARNSSVRAGFNGAAVSQRRKWAGTRRWPMTTSCFNGAAVSQRRKSVLEDARGGRGTASMGPPSLNGGNWLPGCPGDLRKEGLQWGRRLSTAEISPGCGHRRTGSGASMGPPSLNGGNEALGVLGPEEREASMGPPSLNGGNGPPGPT